MKKIFKISIMCLVLITTLILTTACSNSNLKEINYKDYKKLIENKETFILEVMQTGCSHCTDIKPKLEKVTKDYNIEIKYINLTKMSKEDKEELGINGTPTILFYNNGVEETVASRISGDRPIDYIVSKFKANGFIKEEQ